ncbi:hypothetical protein BC792_102122 [Sphingobacterium allocomposti]|uniref:Uncharacterized protein n=1 Tax=Sphingobacterium allocomposti TaxID=415956 RepID=A0A5S5DP21_9SPHI|nr:hypothetical protein [Sphingobacterium composti Yoo et al. 2007 non Ten et al. 2007]TYP97700.1 hypothetical protein BC792_102122 [Sphingobacterium composti Yoo et al. 2007 non Ten et al. 2007]
MVSRLLFIIFMLAWAATLFSQRYHVDRTAIGKLKDSRLSELSGIIGASFDSTLFWVHNDSGDSARIFLVDANARLKAVYYLEGVHIVDTEDITMFREQGRTFLVLGDIGDNRGVRQHIYLYIFEEPHCEAGKEIVEIPAQQIRKVTMRYEDRPRDAEALFADPMDRRLYLVSKRDFRAGLYPIELSSLTDGDFLILRRACDLPMTFVTAADMSADGAGLLIKNLTQVFFWQRRTGQPLLDLLGQQPVVLPYHPEPQGEAICFGRQNSVFYTISERPLGLDAYLYRYKIVPLD